MGSSGAMRDEKGPLVSDFPRELSSLPPGSFSVDALDPKALNSKVFCSDHFMKRRLEVSCL